MKSLLRRGLVLTMTDGDRTLYQVQKVHMDPELSRKILESMTPFIEAFYETLDTSGIVKEDAERALADNLALFICRKITM